MHLPLDLNATKIYLPERLLRLRLAGHPKDSTIEAISLAVHLNEQHIKALSEDLAKAGKADLLFRSLLEQANRKATTSEKQKVRVIIDRRTAKWIRLKRLSRRFASVHHEPVLHSEGITPIQRRILLEQLGHFLDQDDVNRVRQLTARQGPISVPRYLLPKFARKLAGRFILHRGPNCFHAALAFQSPILAHSALINVKEEHGYHRSMINYDELWRILQRSFYEVDPHVSPLKYGDILAFFQIPEGGDGGKKSIHFTWIRHAAVHLFSNLTFSKGSKSPNSPYAIKTIDQEWSTWARLTKGMAVKVFRRAVKNVKRHPPKDLTDWIY